MFLRLLFLFVAVPAIELALLIEIGKEIGFWPTLGLICATGIMGSILTRKQGLAVWKQFNHKLQNGQLPGNELVDGLIVLVAGALLLTPGVITDFVGFLGLIPYSRAMIRTYLQKRLKRSQLSSNIRFNASFYTRPQDPASRSQSPAEAEWEGTPRERPDYLEE